MRHFFERRIPPHAQMGNIQWGILRRVDRWKMVGDVEFLSKPGAVTSVPIQAGIFSRGMCGGLPAEGSVVQVQYHIGSTMESQPVISGTLPSHFLEAYELNTSEPNPFWGKLRPQNPFVVPGSWYIQTNDLSSLHLVERVGFMLTLPDQQRMWMTYHDHQYLVESPVQTRRSAGWVSRAGVVSRPDSALHRFMTTAGVNRNYVTSKSDGTYEKFMNQDLEGSRMLLEEASLLWETSDTIVPFTKTDEVEADEYKFDFEEKPLFVHLSGTVVGPNKNLPHYGKPWYCTVFDAVDDQMPGNIRFNPIDATLDRDRMVFQFALTDLLYLPREKSFGAFWAIDKQGKMFFKLGRSLRSSESSYQTSGIDEDPLGPHRSLEGVLMGSAKLHVGKNWKDEQSFDVSTEGLNRFRLGKDDGSKGKPGFLMVSIDMSTEGKVKFNIKDDSGAAVDEQLLSVDVVTTRGVRLVINGPSKNDDRAIDVQATGNVYMHATGRIDLVSDVEINLKAPITRAYGDFMTPNDATCIEGHHAHNHTYGPGILSDGHQGE